MSCELSKYQLYTLSSVRKDVAAGKLLARLESPPATCPDGLFVSGSAKLEVLPGAPAPFLQWSSAYGKPVITVPSMGMVQEFDVPGGLGFGGFLLLMAGFGLMGYILYRLLGRTGSPTRPYALPYYTSPPGVASMRVRSQGGGGSGGGTTVVNNNSGGGGSDLLAGVLIGEALSDRREPFREREEERGTYRGDDGSGGSFTGDDHSSDSYSGDSGSFSSDSGSSSDNYSGDSGSFSSDSGSFSSDSGSFGGDSGGSFGGDS